MAGYDIDAADAESHSLNPQSSTADLKLIGRKTVRKQALVSISAAFAVGLYAVSAVPAQAQSYKADDIIKHFGGGKPNLGVSRGL